MFGIGPQEVVLIVLLLLVVFGPAKAAGMARELGQWVNEAHRPVEELKNELASSGTDEESKNEAPHPLEGQNIRAVAVEEDGNEAATTNIYHSEDKQRASSARSDSGMSSEAKSPE